MKDLPKVFVSPIEKDLRNTQEIYYGNRGQNAVTNNNPSNILKKINDIFKSSTHVYKSKVKITLNSEIKEETIVGKSGNNLITIDGKFIKITDIRDIEKV